MKSRLVVYLKIFLSLLFVGYVLFEVYKTVNEDKSKTIGTKYFDTYFDDLQTIEIKPGLQTIKLEFKNSKWFIIDPIESELDSDLIQKILVQIKESDTDELPTVDKELPLIKYDLDDPLGDIVFTNMKGDSLNLSLSATKAFNGDFYLKSFQKKFNKTSILVSNFNWLDFLLRKPVSFLKLNNAIELSKNNLIKVEIEYPYLRSLKTKPKNVFTSIKYYKTKDLWDSSLGKSYDPASVLVFLSDLNSLKINSYEEDAFILKKPFLVKDYLKADFIYSDSKVNTVMFYNKFKDCTTDGKPSECQLLSMTSLPLPFWVDKSFIKTIVEQDFLKK